jgi:hypothetical protein
MSISVSLFGWLPEERADSPSEAKLALNRLVL